MTQQPQEAGMSEIIVWKPEIYIVPVPPGLHRGVDLHRCPYDNNTDERIAEIPYYRPQARKLCMRLGKLVRPVTSDEIRGLRLWEQKKKHADLPRLLLFGTHRPEIPEKGWILAFGSMDPKLGVGAAIGLCRVMSERQLNVVRPNDEGYWPKGTYLLVEEL